MLSETKDRLLWYAGQATFCVVDTKTLKKTAEFKSSSGRSR